MTDSEIEKIQAEIKDLDLDYMRGLVSEDDYQTRILELKSKLEELGGTMSESLVARATQTGIPSDVSMESPKPAKQIMTDPVTAVKTTIQKFRRIPIERISQESGVDAVNVTKILSDLLDGRELSGRIDRDSGDFILGTGTGPPPKTIAVCPYCRTDLKRVAVRGETVTCTICRESFIVS